MIGLNCTILHLLHLIALLFGDNLKLFLHDVVALLKFNRNFAILINLFLHVSHFFTLLIKHLFLLFVSFFELSDYFHLLGLAIGGFNSNDDRRDGPL